MIWHNLEKAVNPNFFLPSVSYKIFFLMILVSYRTFVGMVNQETKDRTWLTCSWDFLWIKPRSHRQCDLDASSWLLISFVTDWQLLKPLQPLLPIFDPRHEKTCLCHMWTTDQPAHPCFLISTFIVCCLDSIIPLLAIAEISRPKLVSSAEQAGLSNTWSQTPKTGFLMTRLI